MIFKCVYMYYLDINVDNFQGKIYTECKINLGSFNNLGSKITRPFVFKK